MHSKTHHEHQTGNVYYVIFIQILLFKLPPKGKSVNARFYKGNVLHKLNKYFLSRRPATGLRSVRLLHDNASSHKVAIVREYLKQEKAVKLPHPPYLPDLATCDSRLKNHLAGRKYRWKKSRFGYFSVSEQYTSKRL